MNYNVLLEGICEMGFRLLGCGAEIFRVEDTIRRLAAAYGAEAEVFAIPNCLIISITDDEGKQLTRMRQAKISGTNLNSLEAYNALSRKLCADPPADPGEILTQLKQVAAKLTPYPAWIILLGDFFGAAFFTMFFSGGWLEALVGGIAGVLAGGCSILLSRLRCNFFINTMVSGFALALAAYSMYILGVPVYIEAAIVGATMVLVPGLVFTNFMSDLLTGDIMAGLSTFARAVLTAGAIAIGTGAAISLLQRIAEIPVGIVPPLVHSPVLACILAFVSCAGFCLTFNIRGKVGTLLCCLGGSLGWAVYLLVEHLGGGAAVSSLFASMVVAVYSNAMARIRKCPVTPYLVVSYFPLVPGFTLYRAMSYGIGGNIQLFLETFILTFSIGGCIALGTLMVSTVMRVFQSRKGHRHATL